MEAMDKIEIMLKERDSLRMEMISVSASMNRSIFIFLTTAAIAAGIYWSDKLAFQANARSILLFSLTQVEYFVLLFLLSRASNQSVHSGYLQSLERRINAVAGEVVGCWESVAVKHYVFHPKSSNFWALCVLVLMLFAFFGVCINGAFDMVNSMLFGILLTLEIALLVPIFVHIYFLRGIVSREVDLRLGESLAERESLSSRKAG